MPTTRQRWLCRAIYARAGFHPASSSPPNLACLPFDPLAPNLFQYSLPGSESQGARSDASRVAELRSGDEKDSPNRRHMRASTFDACTPGIFSSSNRCDSVRQQLGSTMSANLLERAESAMGRGDLFTAHDLARASVETGSQDERFRYLQVLALARMG